MEVLDYIAEKACKRFEV